MAQRTKRIFNKLFNRVSITVSLLLIQILWLLEVFFKLTAYAVWIEMALRILSVLIALHVVRRDENPDYKVMWIALIGLLPLFGGMLYLCFGERRPAKRLRRRMEAVAEVHQAELVQEEGQCDELERREQGLSHYLSLYGGYPAWKNTTATYFANGETAYRQMLQDLEDAERFIFLEYFIIDTGEMWDGIEAILKRKAAQGVDVRLIYDDFGCIRTLPANFLIEMERNKIQCIPFNPVVPILSLAMNHRDHRKILVIDGNVAYNGGINLADEYINRRERFGYWKDIALRIEGAAVWNCTVMFLNTWNAFRPRETVYDAFRPSKERVIASDGVIQPYADSPLDDERVAENVYLDMIHQAREYIWLESPYLAVGHEMLTALELAAKRGVDVRMIVPGIPDKKIVFRLTRTYYQPLLRAGVRIYEYTPGFLHAKCCLCDDRMATVGSVNLDYRSLYLHFECGMLLMENSQLSAIKEDICQTLVVSREIISIPKKAYLGDVLDDLLRLFSPLM